MIIKEVFLLLRSSHNKAYKDSGDTRKIIKTNTKLMKFVHTLALADDIEDTDNSVVHRNFHLTLTEKGTTVNNLLE